MQRADGAPYKQSALSQWQHFGWNPALGAGTGQKVAAMQSRAVPRRPEIGARRKGNFQW